MATNRWRVFKEKFDSKEKVSSRIKSEVDALTRGLEILKTQIESEILQQQKLGGNIKTFQPSKKLLAELKQATSQHQQLEKRSKNKNVDIKFPKLPSVDNIKKEILVEQILEKDPKFSRTVITNLTDDIDFLKQDIKNEKANYSNLSSKTTEYRNIQTDLIYSRLANEDHQKDYDWAGSNREKNEGQETQSRVALTDKTTKLKDLKGQLARYEVAKIMLKERSVDDLIKELAKPSQATVQQKTNVTPDAPSRSVKRP
ncbi:MAG: hypothetical protein NTW08_04225 [Gammaproteobacteria bacterium]|nr:hypothetical protein [Gammaproteobacteria bacterium]